MAYSKWRIDSNTKMLSSSGNRPLCMVINISKQKMLAIRYPEETPGSHSDLFATMALPWHGLVQCTASSRWHPCRRVNCQISLIISQAGLNFAPLMKFETQQRIICISERDISLG
eukprot:scaffold85520_cov36-Prasinocladus_malaysianus.AAC.1